MNKDNIDIIEELDEKLMDHEYDGIMELDNSLPPWWLYMFYATIIFAVAYSAYYFVMDGPSQEQEYITAMAEAEAEVAAFQASNGPVLDEKTVTMATEAADIAEGKATYETLCVACHAIDGGGGVGPNMTDNYWIHGATINDLFRVIKFGVPEKGMISWEAQLRPEQMRNVSTYILTELVGKTPAAPKEAQGDLVE
jgi:cytochrome c oxidase cbb3-type subunit 3